MSGDEGGGMTPAQELLLKPLPRILSRWVGPVTGQLRYGVALDTETTGRFFPRHRIIELCAQRFRYDDAGRIHDVYPAQTWLEDPGEPLEPEIVRITGLTDAVLRQRSIHDGAAFGILSGADVIVAHNSAFDRPFVDARLDLPKRAWACSMSQVDWRAHGFDGKGLGYLLMQMGWRYAAHRAETDVSALMHLLAHELPNGRTALAEMLDRSARTDWRLDALFARFEAAPRFRDRGWRWNPGRRCYSIEMPDEASRDEEIGWAVHVGYHCRGRPAVTQITAYDRFRP